MGARKLNEKLKLLLDAQHSYSALCGAKFQVELLIKKLQEDTEIIENHLKRAEKALEEATREFHQNDQSEKISSIFAENPQKVDLN